MLHWADKPVRVIRSYLGMKFQQMGGIESCHDHSRHPEGNPLPADGAERRISRFADVDFYPDRGGRISRDPMKKREPEMDTSGQKDWISRKKERVPDRPAFTETDSRTDDDVGGGGTSPVMTAIIS